MPGSLLLNVSETLFLKVYKLFSSKPRQYWKGNLRECSLLNETYIQRKKYSRNQKVLKNASNSLVFICLSALPIAAGKGEH